MQGLQHTLEGWKRDNRAFSRPPRAQDLYYCGGYKVLNRRGLKKKLLAIPWWAMPFVVFGVWDMDNSGVNYTNTLIAGVPLALAVFFFIYKLKTTEPKKNLKRERI